MSLNTRTSSCVIAHPPLRKSWTRYGLGSQKNKKKDTISRNAKQLALRDLCRLGFPVIWSLRSVPGRASRILKRPVAELSCISKICPHFCEQSIIDGDDPIGPTQKYRTSTGTYKIFIGMLLCRLLDAPVALILIDSLRHTSNQAAHITKGHRRSVFMLLFIVVIQAYLSA